MPPRKRLTAAEKGGVKQAKKPTPKKPATPPDQISSFTQSVQEEWPTPFTGAINHWLPARCSTLNLAISGGKGWPGGRVAELYGPEQTGKTLISMLAGAQIQQQGGLFAVIHAEGRKPEGLMTLTGVQDHPDVLKEYGYDEGANALEQVHDIIEKLILKKLQFPSAAPLGILVDSVSVLDAQHCLSQEESLIKGKNKPMSAALLWTRFFKRDVIKAIAGRPIWIWLISHVRDSIGDGFFGAKEDKVSGARVIKHMCTTRIRVSDYELEEVDREPQKARSTKDAKAPPMGKLIEYKVEKCGTGPPLRVGQLCWFYDHGAIDQLASWNWLHDRKFINHHHKGLYAAMGRMYTKQDWIANLLTDKAFNREFEKFLKECWDQFTRYPHPYLSGKKEGDVPEFIL